MSSVSSTQISKEARPWWPEISIYFFCLVVLIGMLALDYSDHLGVRPAPKLLPNSWWISRYELELILVGSLAIICSLILEMRRFGFDGQKFTVSRLLFSGDPVTIPLPNIVAVSNLELVTKSPSNSSMGFYGFRCTNGRTIKIPMRYVGAKELGVAVSELLNAR